MQYKTFETYCQKSGPDYLVTYGKVKINIMVQHIIVKPTRNSFFIAYNLKN